jgi:hypothetical protein
MNRVLCWLQMTQRCDNDHDYIVIANVVTVQATVTSYRSKDENKGQSDRTITRQNLVLGFDLQPLHSP